MRVSNAALNRSFGDAKVIGFHENESREGCYPSAIVAIHHPARPDERAYSTHHYIDPRDSVSVTPYFTHGHYDMSEHDAANDFANRIVRGF